MAHDLNLRPCRSAKADGVASELFKHVTRGIGGERVAVNSTRIEDVVS